MSNQAITWAYQQDVTPAGAKFVLVTLANYANQDGFSYPSQSRLAHDTGMTDRSVRNAMTRLVDLGILRREHRINPRTQHRTSDGYWLIGMDSQEMDSASQRKITTESAETVSAKPLVTPKVNRTEDSLRSSSVSGKPRKRNEVWDATAALCGAPETKNEISDFGTTVSQLREVGATPEQIGGFGLWWYENHNVRMTHRCLRDHWGSYKNAPPRPVPVRALKNGHASPRDNVAVSMESVRIVREMLENGSRT